MLNTNVQTLDAKDWRERFLKRDLPVAYLMVRATMGFHMIAHGGARLPILPAFAAETRKEFAGVTLLGLPLFQDWLVTLICYIIPPTEFVIGLLLSVGFKTRLACTAGNVLFLVMMFGQVVPHELWHGARHVVVCHDFRPDWGAELCRSLFGGSDDERAIVEPLNREPHLRIVDGSMRDPHRRTTREGSHRCTIAKILRFGWEWRLAPLRSLESWQPVVKSAWTASCGAIRCAGEAACPAAGRERAGNRRSCGRQGPRPGAHRQGSARGDGVVLMASSRLWAVRAAVSR